MAVAPAAVDSPVAAVSSSAPKYTMQNSIPMPIATSQASSQQATDNRAGRLPAAGPAGPAGGAGSRWRR
jgi:hypothetical protein